MLKTKSLGIYDNVLQNEKPRSLPFFANRQPLGGPVILPSNFTGIARWCQLPFTSTVVDVAEA